MDELFPVERAQEWLFPKPIHELMRHSLTDRWEFTRRHPVYLHLWKVAGQPDLLPDGESGDTPKRRAARQALAAIGVGGVYPPPQTTVDEWGDSILGAVWIEGAIAPQSFRSLLSILLIDLPPEVCRLAGELLIRRSRLPDGDSEQLYDFLQEVVSLSTGFIDRIPNRALVGVNLTLSSNILTETFKDYVKKLKADQNIPATRRRDDKTDDYLVVWDAVEGWWSSDYYLRSVWTKAQVIKQFDLDESTFHNRYKLAYRAIVGRPYNHQDWMTLFGNQKILQVESRDQMKGRYAYHGHNSRSVQIVPETTLSGRSDGHPGSLIGSLATSTSDNGTRDLGNDILALIRKNRTDSEIIEQLELIDPMATQLVQYFRVSQELSRDA